MDSNSGAEDIRSVAVGWGDLKFSRKSKRTVVVNRMIQAKPCPFCGCVYEKDDEDVLYSGDHEEWCPLGVNGPLGYNFTFDDYWLDDWNRRAEQ